MRNDFGQRMRHHPLQHLALCAFGILCAGVLRAEELRLVQEALGEITGQVTTEALLGQIFSEFCIGK